MANSLSLLANSAENCPIEEWVAIGCAPHSERIVAMHEKRDPLTDTTFPGVKVTCVCGFSTGTDCQALIYFWCEGLGVIDYRTLRKREQVRNLVELAVMVGSVGDGMPSFNSIKGLFGQRVDVLFEQEPEELEVKHLYWADYGDLKFVALFSIDSSGGGFSTESVLNCLNFHHDYFQARSPVRHGVPMAFLFEKVKGDPTAVARLLLEPKCFDPFQNAPNDWFLWPWQRSLRSPDGASSVQYGPIETTSLVFDLRKSTMALEQLPFEAVGQFSDFIKEVVATAKTTIFEHGGFFDKETGDGIIAHFTDFELPGLVIGAANHRAFSAAKSLIENVNVICERFQDKLNMGVGGLGGSVGIHSGKAVWICENNLISAIGESAILAARLCAEAENLSIFVSNYEFHRLGGSLPPEEVAQFDRRPYRGKEYDDRSKLFGYAYRLGVRRRD